MSLSYRDSLFLNIHICTISVVMVFHMFCVCAQNQAEIREISQGLGCALAECLAVAGKIQGSKTIIQIS